MKLSRLNEYREINSTIAENKRTYKAASAFLYAEDRFPDALAELAEKTKAIEEYREKNYGDVVEFLGDASLKDFTTGRILQGYYHHVMSWDELGAAYGMTAKAAKALAAAYTEENCEKDPEPAAPSVPISRAAVHASMYVPKFGVVSQLQHDHAQGSGPSL